MRRSLDQVPTARRAAAAAPSSPLTPAGRVPDRRVRAALAAALALAAGGAADAQTIVSPLDRATYEGSSRTSYPLGRADARLQTLHADIGMPRTISGHAYRRDAISTRGLLESFRVELGISLSISPTSPDQASRTFAANAGTPTLVLPRTWVDFPATNRPAAAPAPTFELRIPYARSYAFQGGTLCVDMMVYGNDGPNGMNENFTSYQDAHELFDDGTCEAPGYRYGLGCSAPGSSTAAYANLTLRHEPTSMTLDIAARYGMPTTAASTGYTFLLFGYLPAANPFWLNPSCSMLTGTTSSWLLPGQNSSRGHWDGSITGFTLPVGTSFYIQVASADPMAGANLGDASHIVVPPLGPTPIPAVRIGHSTNHLSATGSVSPVVPVMEFF